MSSRDRGRGNRGYFHNHNSNRGRHSQNAANPRNQSGQGASGNQQRHDQTAYRNNNNAPSSQQFVPQSRQLERTVGSIVSGIFGSQQAPFPNTGSINISINIPPDHPSTNRQAPGFIPQVSQNHQPHNNPGQSLNIRQQSGHPLPSNRQFNAPPHHDPKGSLNFHQRPRFHGPNNNRPPFQRFPSPIRPEFRPPYGQVRNPSPNNRNYRAQVENINPAGNRSHEVRVFSGNQNTHPRSHSNSQNASFAEHTQFQQQRKFHQQHNSKSIEHIQSFHQQQREQNSGSSQNAEYKNSNFSRSKNQNFANASTSVKNDAASSFASASSVTPIFKFKKNKQKKPETNLNPSQDVQRKIKSEKAKKQGKNRRLRYQQPNRWKKKPADPETASLFSFISAPQTDGISVKDMTDSDEESSTVLSRCTSMESVNTSYLSDEDTSEDDESETMSEVSMVSSVRNSESSISAVVLPHHPKTGGLVSVFWDIENCQVPRSKSTVDFVKLVRTTFYEGRTESTFWVVCDVNNISQAITHDLDQCNVHTVHVNGTDKNAADKKIQNLLQEFRDNCKEENSAVVLISGDSDFATLLHNLNYKFHIHINLICKKNANPSLVSAAHRCIFYEDFIDKLPSKRVEDDIEYYIEVTNFPPDMKSKDKKKNINSKLKGVNCRIKVLDSGICEVVFQDAYNQNRALTLLKGHKVLQNVVSVFCAQRKKGSSSESKPKNRQPKTDKEKKVKVSKSENSENKNTSLYVFVGLRSLDIDYWKNELRKIFKEIEFNLQWDENNEGYVFVHINGVKKAQKAQKILQAAQEKDPISPKFLKIIKNDDILQHMGSPTAPLDLNKFKIDEHARIIGSKKEIALSKFKKLVEDTKKSPAGVPGAAEAMASKLNELNEQKVTFLNFTQKIVERVQSLDLSTEHIGSTLDDILKDYSRECNCISSGLPIYAKKNNIISKIRQHQVVVIRAETGSGKSTQLTQYIWREQMAGLKKGMVVCTQPRKIAAISLARHVCSQVGSGLGDIVGYQVGMSKKKSPKTAILYTTDFTMLKMFMSDEIQDVSYIIVDEAHERTIYTDILLGMLKEYIKTRPDLKIIITSATIDTTIFCNFFGIADNAVLEISGRTFPIEDIWLEQEVNLGWDYFQKSIDTVLKLMKGEPGDILVFLSTPFETEKAMKVLADKLDKKTQDSTRILQLHGKLDAQEQQKIFDTPPKNVRKIVFATNCAETSVTIPGIKFVVDSGMVKESQFDAVRNISVLSVNFVSQSSAEQRRGRAGRTQVGTCYRLYSKANYAKMKKTSEPEILQTNLGQAIMKLMKIGVKDPLQFDFVQSPPKESLRSAMNQLVCLSAVNEDGTSLSEKGQFMAVLPLEPRLGNMIYAGIQENVGMEVIVLACLITLSRSIFFRSADNKLESDTKKLRFCQSDSDFLSYLEVYKEWSTVPKTSRNKWCMLNSINAKSMRTVQEMVNEIMLILENEMGMNRVKNKFSEDATINVSNVLLRLIFYSYYQNLCIFSGSRRLGYMSAVVQDDLCVHPSSSLFTFGQNWRPRFLVYDSLLKTNQTYMINLSPVSEDMIQKEFEKGSNLDVNLLHATIQALEQLELRTFYVSPVGKTVLVRDVIGKKGLKLKEIKNSLKRFVGNDKVEIEITVEKGEIKVIGPQNINEAIEAILTPVIVKGQDQLLAEEKDIFVYPQLCAVFSSGAEISEVVLPGECRDVKVVINSGEEAAVQSVVERLKECGPIRAVREFKRYFKVTYCSPIHANKAISHFENEEAFSLKKILKSDSSNGQYLQYKLKISFLRRECLGVAYLSVKEPFTAGDTMFLLSTHLPYYRSHPLQYAICKKSGDIRITNLPITTDRSELEKMITSVFKPGMVIEKFVLLRKKVYETTKAELDTMKNYFMDAMSKFASQDTITVDLRTPKSQSFRWMAMIFFQDPHAGQAVYSAVKQHRLFSERQGLEFEASIRSFLYCKREVFNSIKDQLEEAKNFFKSNTDSGNVLNINALEKGPNVEIEVSSDNVSEMQNARRFLTDILVGNKISCVSKGTEKLLSAAGRERLLQIGKKYPNMRINVDANKKEIVIFSNQREYTLVQLEINKFLDDLLMENFEVMPLMPERGKPRVLRELLKRYGSDLQGLIDASGVSTVEIDIYRHVLQVRGSASAVEKCKAIIDPLREAETVDSTTEDDAEEAESCPVCFVEISEKYYRLEFCGHAYCVECLLHLFLSTTEFPICCVTPNCGKRVCLVDIRWAESIKKSLEQKLCRKSLADFAIRRQDVQYCPTSDCGMLYRVSEESNIFHCPNCSNAVCTKCGELYHIGMSCELYRCTKKDSDYSLKLWLSQDPDLRKQCPTCSSPIEKNGGCTHMTCWKCKAHMCWLCLQVFPYDYQVYDHQASCPKRG